MCVGLNRKIAGFDRCGGQIPAFSVKNHVGMVLMNLSDGFIDGLYIQKTRKIKTKTVNMIFIRPVANGIDDVLSHHGALGGRIIAAAGAVGIDAIVDSGEMVGDNPVETESFCVKNVVVNHIHHHADAMVVQRFDHLLHFANADSSVKGIAGIGALGNIEVHRIIAPVELRFLEIAFVHAAIVKYRKQLQMGDAKVFDMVKTRWNMA